MMAGRYFFMNGLDFHKTGKVFMMAGGEFIMNGRDFLDGMSKFYYDRSKFL